MSDNGTDVLAMAAAAASAAEGKPVKAGAKASKAVKAKATKAAAKAAVKAKTVATKKRKVDETAPSPAAKLARSTRATKSISSVPEPPPPAPKEDAPAPPGNMVVPHTGAKPPGKLVSKVRAKSEGRRGKEKRTDWWAPTDDSTLRQATSLYKNCWGKVADHMLDITKRQRTAKACESRWSRLQRQDSKGMVNVPVAMDIKSWTQDEDALLTAYVQQSSGLHGTSWVSVAQRLNEECHNERGAQACRGRWRRLKARQDRDERRSSYDAMDESSMRTLGGVALRAASSSSTAIMPAHAHTKAPKKAATSESTNAPVNIGVEADNIPADAAELGVAVAVAVAVEVPVPAEKPARTRGKGRKIPHPPAAPK